MRIAKNKVYNHLHRIYTSRVYSALFVFTLQVLEISHTKVSKKKPKAMLPKLKPEHFLFPFHQKHVTDFLQ